MLGVGTRAIAHPLTDDQLVVAIIRDVGPPKEDERAASDNDIGRDEADATLPLEQLDCARRHALLPFRRCSA
jgi:hypothetical protein